MAPAAFLLDACMGPIAKGSNSDVTLVKKQNQFGVAKLQLALTILFVGWACAIPLNKQLSREDAQCVEDDVEELDATPSTTASSQDAQWVEDDVEELDATTSTTASLLLLTSTLRILTLIK